MQGNKVKSNQTEIPFIVIDSKGQMPSELNDCLKLDLVKRLDLFHPSKFKTLDDVTETDPMIFEELGDIKLL